MDAFAVSISSGIAIRRPTARNALTIGGFFGSFQAFMPLIGWLGGRLFAELVHGVDHWIAFGLLALIGVKMIYESRRANEELVNVLKNEVLLTLAFATSIDALAVGVSFAFLSVPIVAAAVVIGTVTFVFSLIGVFAGEKFGRSLGNKAEIVGGLALIGIGLKILLEHLILA